MSMIGYSAAIPLQGQAGPSGNLPTAQSNPSTENKNQAVADAKTSPTVVHEAVAVVVIAIILLLIGRGYLRNARIA